MAKTATSAAVVEGTVVFTDIVGFTEYTAVRGDDEALEMLSRQDRLVRETLPAGARVVKELGDGLVLWFEDACAALHAALRLQERLEHAPDDALPIWIRVGMHSGRQTCRGDDLIGHDVNVAARVVDVAGPSEVLLSDATRVLIQQCRPELKFEELGPVVMKGIPEPVRLYRALHDA